MKTQRFFLVLLGLSLVAASAVSRLFYGVDFGWQAPFLAPLAVSLDYWWSILLCFWIPVLVLGLMAYKWCIPALTYSYVVAVIWLMIFGGFVAFALAHSE